MVVLHHKKHESDFYSLKNFEPQTVQSAEQSMETSSSDGCFHGNVFVVRCCLGIFTLYVSFCQDTL